MRGDDNTAQHVWYCHAGLKQQRWNPPSQLLEESNKLNHPKTGGFMMRWMLTSDAPQLLVQLGWKWRAMSGLSWCKHPAISSFDINWREHRRGKLPKSTVQCYELKWDVICFDTTSFDRLLTAGKIHRFGVLEAQGGAGLSFQLW